MKSVVSNLCTLVISNSLLKYSFAEIVTVVVVIVWLLDLQLPMQSVPITTKVVSSNPAHGEMCSIQHYVITAIFCSHDKHANHHTDERERFIFYDETTDYSCSIFFRLIFYFDVHLKLLVDYFNQYPRVSSAQSSMLRFYCL